MTRCHHLVCLVALCGLIKHVVVRAADFEFLEQPVDATCPTYGCSSPGSFVVSANKPQIVHGEITWKYTQQSAKWHCSSGMAVAVCTSVTDAGAATVHGFNTSGLAWVGNTTCNTPAYPTIGLGDASVSVASEIIQLLLQDGSWGAIPVVVAPPLGPPLGAAITSNGVMVFPTWESDVAAYLTSGIPHASTVLKGNIHGHDGIFTATSHPVVNSTRVFFSTIFQPTDAVAASVTQSCRLYAIDLRRTLGNRIQVAWELPMSCMLDRPEKSMVPVLLVPKSNTIVLTNGSKTLSAVLDGVAPKWQWTTDTGSDIVSLAHLAADIFVGTINANILRINAATGAIQSTLDMRSAGFDHFNPFSPMLLLLQSSTDVSLLVPAWKGSSLHVLEVEINTGKVVWQTTVANGTSPSAPTVMSQPIILDEGRTVLITVNGTVLGLSR